MRKIGLVLLAVALCGNASRESKTVKAGMKMQEFVMAISKYARQQKPGFIIVPQNGAELAFNKLDTGAGFHEGYLNAVDGFGIEELFANGKSAPDTYRYGMLKKIRAKKTILVSEAVKDEKIVADIMSKNTAENFLCFPRIGGNEDYRSIPAITSENANDITKLSDAKNYLYLINSSEYKNSYYFLKAIAATNYDVVLIDLFKHKEPYTADEIATIRKKANGAKRIVLAYINIGAAENYRYYWNGNWMLGDPAWIKKRYEGYRDEYYVEFWNPAWQQLIYGNDNSYMKKIIDAGFDGAYLDNVEAYYFLYNN